MLTAVEVASSWTAQDIEGGSVIAQLDVASERWRGGAVVWSYNPKNRAAGIEDGNAEVESAAASWNGVGASIELKSEGRADAEPAACGAGELDSLNTVGWRELDGLLAVTCAWFRVEEGTRFFVEADVVIDPTWEWTTSAPVSWDLQSVVAHEFGHVLGLRHSPDGQGLMAEKYTLGTIRRQPTGADLIPLVALYGPSTASVTQLSALGAPPDFTRVVSITMPGVANDR